MTTAAQRIWEAIYAAEFVRRYHEDSDPWAMPRVRVERAHAGAQMVAFDALEGGLGARMPVAIESKPPQPTSRFRKRSR